MQEVCKIIRILVQFTGVNYCEIYDATSSGGLPINLDEICGRLAIEFWLIEFIVLENLCAKSTLSGEPLWQFSIIARLSRDTIFGRMKKKEKKREGRERKYDFLQISRLSSKKALFLRLRAYSCVVKYRDSLFTRNQSANNTWTIFNFNFQWHTQHPNFDAISCTLLPPLSNTWLN